MDMGAPVGPDVYDHVYNSHPVEDRLSLLALQLAMRTVRGRYAYLETGSLLGGSLQPFLKDDACTRIYSIDPRPEAQPDERGVLIPYPKNSTRRMLDGLRPAFGPALAKMKTFDADASAVTADSIDEPPSFCFIDGENTDRAALSDFEACVRLASPDAVIVFGSMQLIFRGYQKCLDLLTSRGISHRAYVLPLTIGVIELGKTELSRQPAIQARLVSPKAPLFIAETLAHYRDGILALKRVPGAGLARWVLVKMGRGQGLEPR